MEFLSVLLLTASVAILALAMWSAFHHPEWDWRALALAVAAVLYIAGSI